MNRIFKVIYSKTKHMYVVASELAKSHSKGKNGGTTSGRALAALVMAALASMSFMAAPMTAEAVSASHGKNNTDKHILNIPDSVVVEGTDNNAQGYYSAILGGNGNLTFSYKIDDDHQAGADATVLGGYKNYAIGPESMAGGGWGGLATGENSTKLGGWNGVVQGIDSTGIAGGSTGDAARYALAMGYGAVVTNDGATPVPSTGTPDATNVATALGFEATANAPGTIAVGHDKGDASGWTVTYQYDKYGNIDTTKAPTITAKNPYPEAYYNRIVKMADGINSHDAVTMEQMTTDDNTKANVAADNIGSKLKVADGTDSKTGLPTMKDASDAEKTANETAWGTAIGTGSIADGNGQLVTGGTVYTALLGKADTNLNNITSAGHSVIYADAQKAVTLVDGAHTTVSSKMNGDTKEYAVNIATGQVASGDGNLVTGGTVYDAIQNAKISGGGSTVDITGKADVTAGNVGRNFSKFSADTEAITDADKKKAAENSEITANENNWGHALGTGSVADSTASDADTNGSKQLVTGGTVYSAIQNTAVWKLSANGDTSGATTIKPGSTVDFSAATDGKDGTKDHSNVVISKDTDSSNVKIGLSNNIVIGEKKANKGGSLSVYRDPSDAAKENGDDQLGSHISIDGSTMSIRYDNGTAASDARGLVLGVANDSYTDTDKKTVSSPLGYMYLQDGSNYYYIHGTMHNDPTALQGRLVYNSSSTGYNYIANIDDGIKFTGDIAKTTPGDTASAEAEANLNPISAGHTLNISGGVTRSEDLSDNNIGVVATGTTYKDVTKSTVDKAGSLSIKLAKDLKGITSIGNQTTSNGTTTGAKITMGTDGTTTISGGDVSVDSNKITNVKSGLTATDGTYADTDKNNAANIGDVHSMITKEAGTTDSKLALKANVAADNIGKNLKGSDGNAASAADQTANEEKWGEAIGTGSVAKDDKKLVTGGTVYSETHAAADGTYHYISAVDSAGKNLATLDSHVYTNETNIANNTTDITDLKNLSNITDAGKTVVKNLAKDSVKVINGTNTTVSEGTDGDAKTYAVNVSNDAIKGAVKDDLDKKANVDASNVTGDNVAKWQSTLGTGSIASENAGLVTGGTVYSEVRPTTDGTYIKTTQTTGENLSALDTQVHTNATNIATNTTNITNNTTDITNLKNLSNITDAGKTVVKNLAKDSVKVINGTNTTVSEGTDGDAKTYAVNVSNDAIKGAVKDDLDKKANVDASNVTGDNVAKWQSTLGTGSIASENAGLVTGGTVYSEVRPTTDGTYIKTTQTTGENLSALDTQVHTNATNIATNTTNITNNTTDITNLKNLSNITDAGETVIKNLAKGAVKVTAGDRVTVDSATDEKTGTITYTVSANNDGKVEKGNTDLVSGDTVNTAINSAMDNAGKTTDNKLALKANVAADNIGKNLKGSDGNAASTTDQTANEEKWGEAIGTGAVASGDKKLVTGGTVYAETHPTANGNYIKAADSAATNLSTLDTQVHTNATNIATNTTNIATNTGDITNLKNLSNITDAGETVIKNLAKGAVKVTAGNRVTVDSATDEKTGTITYTVSANNDGKVEKGNTNLVSGDTVNTAIDKAIKDAGTTTDSKLALKANVDASNIGKNLKDSNGNAASADDQTANEEKWGEAIGTGSVAKDDKKLVTGKTVYDALHGGLDNITVGKDGKDGKDGSIGIAGKDGKDGYTMTIIKTEQGAAGVDGKDGITRVIYQDKDGNNKHTMATLDDGLKFKGDDSTVIAKKLDEQLDITGGADSTKLTDKNIGVNSDNGSLKIQLAKDLTGITSITSQTTDGAAGGKITFNDKGTTISGGDVSVDNNKITNLAPGTADTDAATVKQVNDVNARADANSAAIKTNADNIEKNGKAIEKNSAAIKTNADNIEKNSKAIEKNSAAIKTNADNIEKNGKAIEQNSAAIKTNADNIEKNGKAIEQNSAAIKTNSDNIEKISKTVEQTTSQVATNSSNIEKNGKAIEQNSAAIKTNSDNIEKNSAAIESLGQNKANIDASNIGKNLKDADGKAASADAVKANEDAWGDAIGTGKVESGNKQLVTGDTVYNELRPTSDGSYIRKDSTTAQNLKSLDTQVKKTADLINSDGETIKIGGSDTAAKIDVSGKDSGGSSTARIITGVQTDADDPTSAANVGYVNEVSAANTQQIYRDMNSAYGRLDKNISKAAAGSNTLAALHPLDYDPGDKASYAVGYGHYRNANAAAVGAFYQPNENTMVSVGVSMGNGDPGVNAGVSFKVGKGSTFNGVSKAQMAETIAAQEKQISEIKASDVAKDKRIDSLEKENQEMKKQIQEILAKLGQ